MKQKSNLFKTLGIMLLFVLFATQANAQNITVTGTVSDNLGPVIGASIQVEGTSNGCITGPGICSSEYSATVRTSNR